MQTVSLTVEQFAKRHSVSIPTVFRWLKDGRLRSIKVGHLRRVTLEQEKEFVERHTSQIRKPSKPKNP